MAPMARTISCRPASSEIVSPIPAACVGASGRSGSIPDAISGSPPATADGPGGGRLPALCPAHPVLESLLIPKLMFPPPMLLTVNSAYHLPVVLDVLTRLPIQTPVDVDAIVRLLLVNLLPAPSFGLMNVPLGGVYLRGSWPKVEVNPVAEEEPDPATGYHVPAEIDTIPCRVLFL